MSQFRNSLLIALSLTSACAVGPNYKRPPVTVPAETRGQVGSVENASIADDPWWEVFQDDALQSLVDEAIRSGYDLKLAAWRVEEARAIAGIARSDYFPDIDAGAGWSRSRTSRSIDQFAGTVDLASASVALSWEIDLWGRVRRLDEAARAQYLATVDARRGVLLSLVSDVASSYFELRLLDLRLDIAKRISASLSETYDLFERRFKAGTASALETSSAEASLESTSADIPDLERRIAAAENRLSLLLGRNPGPIPRGPTLDEQALPPEVPPGLPSALLERRPDLREAEQALVAANAEVGVSIANLYPTVSLTGILGGVAPQVSELFDAGRTWSVGAGLLAPVFHGGRLRNEHRAAVARWEQAKARFEQSVTNAFSETATALVAYEKLVEVERKRARSVAAQRDAVKLSNERYRGGLADYLEVLQAQQSQFAAENALADVRLSRLTSLVQLYKALGGGWNLPDDEWSHTVASQRGRS